MLDVLKVGGSCLDSAKSFEKLLKILQENNNRKVLVVSALKNVTNLLEKWFDDKDFSALEDLLEIHRNIFEELFPEKEFGVDFPFFEEIKDIHLWSYERNEVLALGEKMSSNLVDMYLRSHSFDIVLGDRDPYIFGDNDSLNFEMSVEKIKEFYELNLAQNIVTQGYASWSKGSKNNLGREGSDLSVVIWAHALSADSCILYKDVGALYSADPKQNKDAEKIPTISFADYKKNFFGAGIVYDKVIDFCLEHNQKISIYSFDENTKGTDFLL